MEIKQTNENALSASTVSAIINAPFEKVNIADWLLNLPDAEYQRCSAHHIAAGNTTTYDGEPMSINVETIGDALVIQHYVATVHRPDYCRMLSISDTLTASGRSKVQVLWELKAERIDEKTTRYTNSIHATATPEFQKFISEHGISLAQAAKARQEASDAHNREETPNFAKSIENKALFGKYNLPF
ncbi:hypothetical protein SAMN05660461_0966 [Chitinophaga ginsengisegetis]|uniref:Polyketide cyclase / dehydrase and lipid transport n=1 Tax=Chitinophaga ginsengisegetis TaxID=393003 RepID=A0A1T5NAZ9_9BACT|nr:hypothetical protein [Chitinophaga ginsengisegetis]SKC97626.1 hypothetical protein SAMN05660461_0966 [Chitinophaga ginsengisegetis]